MLAARLGAKVVAIEASHTAALARRNVKRIFRGTITILSSIY